MNVEVGRFRQYNIVSEVIIQYSFKIDDLRTMIHVTIVIPKEVRQAAFVSNSLHNPVAKFHLIRK